MTERKSVAQAALAALANGEESLLVTVIRVGGSTYRRPGARMLLTEKRGRVAGSISGGCLEGDLLKKAWWRTKGGPTVLTYDSTEDNSHEDEEISWGFGLGCNGVVEVLLERITKKSAWHLALLNQDQPTVIATIIRGTKKYPVGSRIILTADAALWASRDFSDPPYPYKFIRDDMWVALEQKRSSWQKYSHQQDKIEVFMEYLAPPQPLVIFGAGHDVSPIVKLAKELLGWHVTVIDTRSARPRPERFPDADVVLNLRLKEAIELPTITPQTAVLLMTHHYPDDEKLLGPLLASDAHYIGVLGPKRRTERILAGLENPDTDLSRLYAPLGLDIGADNPEEIALSVLAEIKAVLSGRNGGLLRERNAPIHPQNETLSSLSSLSNSPKEPIACALASD
jgi:xanthine dehydrogenase accessory factor